MLCKRTCLVLPIHWIFPVLFWRVFLIWQLTCSVWPSRTRNSASWPIRQSWGLLFSVLTFNSISAVSRIKQLQPALVTSNCVCSSAASFFLAWLNTRLTPPSSSALQHQTTRQSWKTHDDMMIIMGYCRMIIILPCLTEHMPYRLTPLDWLLDIPWTICGTFCYR